MWITPDNFRTFKQNKRYFELSDDLKSDAIQQYFKSMGNLNKYFY